MVVAGFEHTETRFVLQIGHLDLLLQLDMFLFSFVKLHDFDSLLLHQTTLLDVELFLRLRRGGKEWRKCRKEGRREGKKEGREGRKKGRKEGKQGRKEGKERREERKT